MNAKQILMAGMAVVSCPLTGAAAENYYVAVLNCQDETKHAHAFAVYIETTEEEGGKGKLHRLVRRVLFGKVN